MIIIINIYSNFRLFYGLTQMDTNNPLNSYLVSSMVSRATEVSVLEGFLEAAPQLILQLHIFLSTGNLSKSLLFVI